MVMQKHSAKRPGEWKDRPNQAGSTYFVALELVPGTLREGFERIRGLAHPLARAIMTIPTVYREDYLLPLKALSHHQQAEPLIRSMTRIQRWSAAFDYSMPRPALRNAMARCNAFQEDLRNYRLLFPEA